MPRQQSLPTHYDSREQLPAPFVPTSEYATAEADGASFDLRKYLWLLFKHRWLILGAVTLTVCVGLVTTFLSTPIYRASATIQINRDVAQVVTGAGSEFQQVDNGRDAEFFQTQYELLKSRSLAERVVRELKLQDDTAFMASDAPSPWSNLKRLIFGAPPAAATSASADVAARQKGAAGRVLDAMGLQPVNGSTIVKITYDSPNPQVAQNVANGIIDNYIGANLDRRYGAASYARTFLEERLQQLKLKLEESEKQSVDYADQNGIILIGGSGGSDGQTLAQTNLAAANSELAKATNERLRNELLWQQVQAAAGIGVPQMLESKSISDLRAKRADLEGTYKDKLSFFKPDYPQMKTLKAQIDEIDREIAAEVNLIRDSIKAQYETSVSQEQALTKQVEGLKADITDFRNRNIQYTILQREVDTNRSLYDGLLQRYR